MTDNRPRLPDPDLRRSLKRARSAVTAAARLKAQQQAWHLLRSSREFRQARTLASYIAVRGEFDTDWLNRQICRSGKPLFLPLLRDSPERHLVFQQITPATRWQRNRFGIPEPRHDARLQCHALELDLVITPLLGFDDLGHRLGMGGGYYDRSFARLRQHPRATATRLIGLAFDCQRVTPELLAQPWDVPLDGLLGESGLRNFRR